MRTVFLLLKMLHDKYPWPYDFGGHNIVYKDGALYLNIAVGVEEDSVYWQQVEISDEDHARNAVEIFRDIVPLMEEAGREFAVRVKKS